MKARKAIVINAALEAAAIAAIVRCAATRKMYYPADAEHASYAKKRMRASEEQVTAMAASMVSGCEAPFKKSIYADHSEMLSLYRQYYSGQRRAVATLLGMDVVPQPSVVAGQPSVYSVDAVIAKIKAALCTSEKREKGRGKALLQAMMAINAKFERAEAIKSRLLRLARDHVASRSKRCFLNLEYVGIDLLTRVVELVDYRSVWNFMLCCRELRDLPAARERLPHLSVRQCVGCFPHAIRSTADGLKHFVNKKDVVKVYVDFCVRGAKLKNEAGPSTATHAPAPAPDLYEFVPRDRRMRREEESRMKRCRHAPEEPVGPETYRVRLPTDCYFSEPIQCRLDLVFADDRQPVPCTRHVPPIELSRLMYSSNAPTATFTSTDGVPYPAHMTFKMNALSCEHGGRQFALKVVGTTRGAATTEDCGRTVELVAYSNPFFVMANASSAEAFARRLKHPRHAR